MSVCVYVCIYTCVRVCARAWNPDPSPLLFPFQSFFKEIEMDDPTRAAVVQTCCYFQLSVREASVDYYAELRRHNYVTPTS